MLESQINKENNCQLSIVNCQLEYSVRNYRSVENNINTCISRGLATVFHGSGNAPRERQDVITFATEVVLLENKVKMRFNNSFLNVK
jgi:hypothetical protein